ncbi:hypothetical protein QKQ25_gp112 [Hyphantria cunea granulovirus]|uniref:Uncharacterized protein n=1 Tax=Hyphantria cunea granulovirus TaxID=307448 RepID=A0AAE6D0N7_9BBAC|nr:hypothetical protein QKQ25_gp112 [Hyphantria cunea granulovirus]QBQ01665.1 hypothetical protein HycuGV_00112 [Hyphantria cunea granulovirus]
MSYYTHATNIVSKSVKPLYARCPSQNNMCSIEQLQGVHAKLIGGHYTLERLEVINNLLIYHFTGQGIIKQVELSGIKGVDVRGTAILVDYNKRHAVLDNVMAVSGKMVWNVNLQLRQFNVTVRKNNENFFAVFIKIKNTQF